MLFLPSKQGKRLQSDKRSTVHFLNSVAAVAFLYNRRQKHMGKELKNILAFASC